MNLTSGSGDEISNKIKKVAESLKNREITPSLIMFIKFLANSDSIKNVLEEKSLESVFDVCCDIAWERLNTSITELNLQDHYQEIELTELEEACFEFIRQFVRKSLIAVFKIHSKISEATEKDQKKKLAKFTQEADDNMWYFTTLYNKITKCAQLIFLSATETVKRVMDDATTLHEEENTDKEKPSTKAKDLYIIFQAKLFDIVYVSNKFLDYIDICMLSLASEKEHKMTRHLNSLCRKSIDLLHWLGNFCT
jgi:hypothetical protein